MIVIDPLFLQGVFLFSLRNEHLSDGWKFELLTTKRDILKGIGKELQIRKPISVLSIIGKTEHNTQKIIADELGWST